MARNLELKTRWSLYELAYAMGEEEGGKPSNRKVRKLLQDHGVPIKDSKGPRSKSWVYLIDLQRMWPEAWLSILRIRELKNADMHPVSILPPPARRG